MDAAGGGCFSFLVGKKSETKFESNQKEPPVQGRDTESGGSVLSEMFCFLGCLILCLSVFFKN